MSQKRDVRRCALQVMYQFDCGRADAPGDVRQSLEESPGDEQAREEGFSLASIAWEFRDEADRAVARLTPEWPIHRQPVIDRTLLRLAYYEMFHGGVPGKIVINEAVELAKEFSTEKSPAFINGVLDRLLKQSNASAGS